MYGWLSAIAIASGTCAGIAPAGGGTGLPVEWNNTPVCCWVRPLHSASSTGSDTVGKPTSTVRSSPRAHTAFHAAMPAAVSRPAPSISTTRVRAVGGRPAPVAAGRAAARPGGASLPTIALIAPWRRSRSGHSSNTSAAPTTTRSARSRQVTARLPRRR
jgi:hypothetical protein